MDEQLNLTPETQNEQNVTESETPVTPEGTHENKNGFQGPRRSKHGVSFLTFGIVLIAVIIASVLLTFTLTREALTDQFRQELIKNQTSSTNSAFLQKFAKIEDIVKGNYIKDYDLSQAEDAALYAFFDALGDNYTFYMDADEYSATMTDSAGIVAGIGVRAVIDPDTGHICIMTVMPDSPALKAGLEPLDRIIKVSDTEVTEENYSDCINLIKGAVGTDVTFTVKRGEEVFDVTCTRASVNNVTVEYRKLENNIALIRITEFVSTTPEQFKAAMQQAQDDGCEKYIFDMRNNPGGNLGAIEEVLDYLLPEGPIINIVYADGTKDVYNSDASCFDAPMVVLCNGSTASAGELFTAALRDYEKATIIGETTFGKGTMQTIQSLGDGSGFRMSIAYYNPPCNVSYDGTGITPDIEIKLTEEQLKYFYFLSDAEDPQLQAAINELNK